MRGEHLYTSPFVNTSIVLLVGVEKVAQSQRVRVGNQRVGGSTQLGSACFDNSLAIFWL